MPVKVTVMERDKGLKLLIVREGGEYEAVVLYGMERYPWVYIMPNCALADAPTDQYQLKLIVIIYVIKHIPGYK